MKKRVLLVIVLLTAGASVFAQRTAEQYDPDKFYLTVTSNIEDANVYIDSRYVGKSNSAFIVFRGRHNILVKAYGCSEYSATVNVNRNTKVSAFLKKLSYRLKLTSNAENTMVWINGIDYGKLDLKAPFLIDLSAGQINIKILAEGYFLFEKLADLTCDTDFYAEMVPQTATIRLDIPGYYLAAYRNALKFIILSVDGKVYRGHELELCAGKHDVTITTGGISFTQTMFLKPGGIYEISPNISLSVNQLNQGLTMR